MAFGNINFPQDESSPDDYIIESLKELKNGILWRKSTKQALNHFQLRRDEKTGTINEIDASLFKLISSSSVVTDDTGESFLTFFFSHPARYAFCKNPNNLRESIAVSFYPKQLLNLINSSSLLKDKFIKLELSNQQNYGKYATHYGLFYQKKLSGEYCDLDDDVTEALNSCSKINPDTQIDDYTLFDEVIHKCKKDILSLLREDFDNTENKKNKKKYQKCIKNLLTNFPELKEI